MYAIGIERSLIEQEEEGGGEEVATLRERQQLLQACRSLPGRAEHDEVGCEPVSDVRTCTRKL